MGPAMQGRTRPISRLSKQKYFPILMQRAFPLSLLQERNQASSSGGLSEQERREKKTLEKKLLEMEEELRVRKDERMLLAKELKKEITL